MIRLPQLLNAACLAVAVTLTACASGDVSATAERDSELASTAELTCCQEAAMDGKTECCGQDIKGQYCPVTGAKLQEGESAH